MEGQEVKNFDALQTSNYPEAVRTTVVAVRSPLKEGEVSLNAKEKQFFDLFFMHQGKLSCRYLYWEPMVYRGDGLLQQDEDGVLQRGWLGQVGLYTYTCPSCAQRGRVSEKDIPSYSINKVKKKNEKYKEQKNPKHVQLECGVCHGGLVRKTRDSGGPLPQLRPTPNQGLEDQIKDMVCGEPHQDVIPRVMGIFHTDEAPGVWVPQTEFQREVALRAAKKNRVLLPYNAFKGMKVPQLKGVVLVCKPFACGPVANPDLYKKGRTKKDKANVGHFQQILLGEPETDQRWNRFS